MKNKSGSKLVKLVFCFCTSTALNEALSAVEQSAGAAPAAKAKTAPIKRAPASSNAQLGSYLMRLRGRLLRVWEPTDGKNTVVLEAVIEPTGAVSEIKTSNSRAGDIAIQSATMAFDKIQPLEALPISEKNKGKLSITFNSTVDPHGDSTSNIMTRIDPLPGVAATQEANTTKGDNTQTSPNK
jgi:hypothetical protein